MDLMTPTILKKLNELIIDDDVAKFYKLKEWQRIRRVRLSLDHNECQVCARYGRHRRANTVHHLKHVKDYPELALTLSNTETICRMHHNREHPEKLAAYHEKKFDNIERW